MNLRKFTNFDYLLFLSVIILSGIGVLFIYSSAVNSEGVVVSREYLKQIIWIVTGLVLLVFSIFFNYQKYKDRTLLLYLFGIFLLIYTLLFGRYVNGAKSWIGIGELGIQISEFMKLFYIFFLAYYFDKSENEEPLKRFIKAGIISAIPFLLILAQPDLGTASVFIPIFLIMCFVVGIPNRYTISVFCIVLLTLVFTLMSLWETTILHQSSIATKVMTNKSLMMLVLLSLTSTVILALIGYLFTKARYYYWITYVLTIITISFAGSLVGIKVLKKYQMMRLIIFLDPTVDPLGFGWNIIQSITAIGSGGQTGVGFLKGTQSHYRFLPQQSTDFIFSILSEEWGFMGGLIIFGLYAIIFMRILSTMKRTKNDIFCKLIATGILAMFVFHFSINIGMVMGIMPITGIPLLFLSYGGSSLWTALIATGLLININLKQL